MKQYDLWWADLELPAGARPVLLLSRDAAYRMLTKVLVCEISRQARGLRTEVAIGARSGLPAPSVANLDNVRSVAVARLRDRIGRLPLVQVGEVKEALGFALGWEELARR